MPYMLCFTTFSGMTEIPRERDSRKDARRLVAFRLRSLRAQGYVVSTIARGESWEIHEREDAVAIDDECGILTLRKQYEVDVWDERDNLQITLKCGDDEIASWSDDDARQMFDDGFFKRRNLDDSVIAYAHNIGLITED